MLSNREGLFFSPPLSSVEAVFLPLLSLYIVRLPFSYRFNGGRVRLCCALL